MNRGFEHYYGDEVRRLFILGGLIMLITYPFFRSLINVPLSFSVAGCLVLAIFCGLTNPKLKWVIVLNTIIPIVAFPFFQYFAVYTYINLPPAVPLNLAFFWVNQILSIIFFLVAYLSTKTLRGALFPDRD